MRHTICFRMSKSSPEKFLYKAVTAFTHRNQAKGYNRLAVTQWFRDIPAGVRVRHIHPLAIPDDGLDEPTIASEIWCFESMEPYLSRHEVEYWCCVGRPIILTNGLIYDHINLNGRPATEDELKEINPYLQRR